MSSLMQFRHWLWNSQAGDRHVYHTGRLAGDREIRPELNTLAMAVWSAYEGGLVWLFQVPVDDVQGNREHDYVVIRTRRRA